MSGPARSPRHGFTIIESMVALTLFAVGLLGMAGTAAAIQRLSAAATARAEAAALGWSRLEELRATACGARAAGSAVTRGITERWMLGGAPGVTTVSDSLLLPPSPDGAVRQFGFATVLPC
jgi:prepilin-type N-terminal cleavage/methylation domain-containing protein